jgi:hypothetical protein
LHCPSSACKEEKKESKRRNGKRQRPRTWRARRIGESKEQTAIKKSLHRLGWEVHHRFFGVGLLATAWWQLHSGWELYEEEVGGEDLGVVFLGVAGGSDRVIIYVVQKMRAKANTRIIGIIDTAQNVCIRKDMSGKMIYSPLTSIEHFRHENVIA